MPRPLLHALFAVYLVALALIGFWPTTVDRGLEYAIWEVVGWCSWNGCAFLDYPLIERVANVLLFLPFGLLLAAAIPRGRRGWAIAVCIAASVGIELVQLLFLPGRYPSLSDVLTNSLGGTLGVLIVIAVSGGRHRRTRERDDPVELPTPTASGVGVE